MAHPLFEGQGNYFRRVLVLVLGLSIMAFAIAMSKKAFLGTSPISCIPATLTDCYPEWGLTLGDWTIVFNLILVGLQVCILRRDYRPVQVLQILLAVFLGKMTDVSMDYLLFFMNADSYVMQWIFCILSCALLGLGVMIEIKAKLLVVPGDGLVIAMAAHVRKLDFRKLKLLTDSSMVIIAAVISLCAVSYLTGAREGSIFAAIAISNFLWFFRNRLGKYIDRFLGDETGARASRDRDRPPRRLPADSRCEDRVHLG